MAAMLAQQENLILVAPCLLMAIGAALVGGIIAIAVWVTVKYIIERRRMGNMRQLRQEGRLDSSGQPLPPTAPGLCDTCQKAADKVYYMPSGKRLCEACFRNSGG